MKVGGRVVKFKRSERSVAETRTGKILPKKVGQKSCVKKARKPAPPASPPEPTEWQVEMRRARERRARGAEPDLKQRMLDVSYLFDALPFSTRLAVTIIGRIKVIFGRIVRPNNAEI